MKHNIKITLLSKKYLMRIGHIMSLNEDSIWADRDVASQINC